MPLSVKQGGTIKTVTGLSVKQAGTWKAVQNGYVKQAGVWKLFYTATTSGLTVAIEDRVISAIQPNYAGSNPTLSLTFANDGTHKSTINLGSAVDTVYANQWLSPTPQSSATCGNWEIRFTLAQDIDTGTLSGVTLGSWLPLSTSRVLSYALSGIKLTASCRILIEIRDTASQVLRDSATYTISLSKASVIYLNDHDFSGDRVNNTQQGYNKISLLSNGQLQVRHSYTGAITTLSPEWRRDQTVAGDSLYQVRAQIVSTVGIAQPEPRPGTDAAVNTWLTLNTLREWSSVYVPFGFDGSVQAAYQTWRISIRRVSDSQLLAERLIILGTTGIPTYNDGE